MRTGHTRSESDGNCYCYNCCSMNVNNNDDYSSRKSMSSSSSNNRPAERTLSRKEVTLSRLRRGHHPEIPRSIVRPTKPAGSAISVRSLQSSSSVTDPEFADLQQSLRHKAPLPNTQTRLTLLICGNWFSVSDLPAESKPALLSLLPYPARWSTATTTPAEATPITAATTKATIMEDPWN